MNRTKAFICDIDGTVALHEGIRGHYEYDKVHLDLPNKPVIDIVKRLEQKDYVIFVTGRPARCREATTNWLTNNVCYPDELFMRPDFLLNGKPDYRPDYIVKEEIYYREIEKIFDIQFCLDDRDQVVAMWRSLGLTCLQVAEGKF